MSRAVVQKMRYAGNVKELRVEDLEQGPGHHTYKTLHICMNWTSMESCPKSEVEILQIDNLTSCKRKSSFTIILQKNFALLSRAPVSKCWLKPVLDLERGGASGYITGRNRKKDETTPFSIVFLQRGYNNSECPLRYASQPVFPKVTPIWKILLVVSQYTQCNIMRRASVL